jgi:hypothetical protein
VCGNGVGLKIKLAPLVSRLENIDFGNTDPISSKLSDLRAILMILHYHYEKRGGTVETKRMSAVETNTHGPRLDQSTCKLLPTTALAAAISSAVGIGQLLGSTAQTVRSCSPHL